VILKADENQNEGNKQEMDEEMGIEKGSLHKY